MKHEIKTATAVYTGGGIYIYYGELESGQYFRTDDEYYGIDICDADPSTEEATYLGFYETHVVEEIPESDLEYFTFWNAMLDHILNGGTAYGNDSNYSTYELERRRI